MKKFRLLFCLVVSLMLTLIPLSACGGGEEPPVTYSVTYSVNDSAYGSLSCAKQDGTAVESGDQLEENTVLVFTATENTGYQFDGYYSGSENKCAEKEYTVTLTSSLELVAKFSAKVYALSFSATTGGTATGETLDSGDSVEYNTSITLTATESTGYDFIGWYVGTERLSTELEYTFSMPASDYAIEAKFIPEQHFFKYQVNDATMGYITSSTTNETEVNFGTEISLTASANSGYKFIGWFINGVIQEESVNFIYTMTENSVVIEARFDLDEFALTYSVNDSNMGEIDCEYESGELIDYQTTVLLTAIENTGYDFVEWLVDGESKGSSLEYTLTMGVNAVQVQAIFVAEKRTVTFYDGRDQLKEQEVDYNSKINFEPTKLNYNFEGWYLESTLTTKFNVNNPITQDLDLYAKWTAVPQNERQYEVNFVDHEGNPLNGWGTQLVQYGKYIKQIPNVPERVGYTFNNQWMKYDDAQGKYVDISNISSFQITEDVTITPKYNIITYTVKLYTNDVSYTTKTVEYGSKLAKPQTPTNSDATKVFDKWVYKEDTSMAFDFENTVITSDLELMVTWKTVYAETFTVEFYYGSTRIDTQKIENGSKATEPTPSEVANMTFEGWYLDQVFENEFDFETTISSNLTVYANYVPKTYTVKFMDHDGRVIEAQTVSHGQSATAPSAPNRTGYTFKGWSVSDLTEITSDLEVYAEYDINICSITFVGFEGATLDTQSIEYGAFASIPELTDITGYSFEGWYLDEDFEKEFDFRKSVTTSFSVYAKYVIIETTKYDVVFYDEDGVTKISEQKVVSGNSAIVPANPTKEGHDFIGWEIVEEYGDYTNVKQNLTVKAKYQPKAFKVQFFEADGTTQIGEDITVYYNQLVNASDIPTAKAIENMVHTGWDKDIENLKITKDTKFVAVYAYEPCTVTFIIEGEEPFIQVVDKGFYANIPNTPIKNYSIFDGWYLSGSDTEFNFSTQAITEDITLYAKFVRTSYVISFVGYDGNPYGNVQIVKAGGKAIEPAPYDDGTLTDYIWCLENETEEFDFIGSTIDSDIVLYAKLPSESN